MKKNLIRKFINKIKERNMKKFFSKLLIILICALFLEVIVFNITSYRTFWGKYEKKYYDEGEII